MQHILALVALVMATILVCPSAGESQTWPEPTNRESGVTWIVGSYAPLSGLGRYGDYGVSMDAWPIAGISLRPGAEDATFRTRFEITAIPGVAMRRSPLENAASLCEDCSSDALRLTVVNSRFLLDVTTPFVADTRAYVTAGPAMRLQFSDPEECPASAGGECALPEFGRSRLDPGLVAGVGWEPQRWSIQAVQLTGRMSLYGRGERDLASPNSWLPELDLVVRFSL